MESIAYQIADLIVLMRQDSGIHVEVLRVDGGPTASRYLMQFQSDMGDVMIQVPEIQELSGMGAALVAGIAAGVYDPEKVFEGMGRQEYWPQMERERRKELYAGWKEAVARTLLRQ